MANAVSINIDADFSKAKRELDKFKTLISGTSLQFGSGSIKSVNNDMEQLGKTTKSVGATIAESASKMALWMGLGAIIASVTTAMKSLGEEVVSLDADLTLMAFTSEFTNEQFEDMIDLTEGLATSLGSTMAEVREASKLYTSMSASMQEIIDNSEASVVLSNLGGSAISIRDASSAVLGLQNQFDLANNSGLEIADTLAFISASLKIDFAEGLQSLSSSVSIAGASAKAAGLEYEEYLAIIGRVAEETRRSGNSIASGVKTIISRLLRVKELGAETVSEVQEAYRAVGDGIEIMANPDEFKDFSVIIGELSGQWDELTEAEQRHIAFLTAGTRQQDVFLAIMNTYSSAMDLATDATENFGFATEKNEIFVESLQGRINLFRTAMQELSRDTLSVDLFKTIVDGGTEFIKTMNAMENSVGIFTSALLVALPLLILWKQEMLKNALIATSNLIPSLIATGITIKSIGIQATLASAGVGLLRVSMLGLSAIFAGLVIAITAYNKKQAEMKQEIIDTGKELEKFQDTSLNVKTLIDSLSLAEKGTQEYYDITQKLADLLPDATSAIDEENDSIETQVELYKNLLISQQKYLVEKAKEVIANSESEESLRDQVRWYEERIPLAQEEYDTLVARKALGEELDATEKKRLSNLTEGLELYRENLDSVLSQLRAWESAINAIIGLDLATHLTGYSLQTGFFVEAVEDSTDSLVEEANALDKVKEAIEDTSDSIDILTEDFEFMSEAKQIEVLAYVRGEIEKTRILKEETQKRLTAYEAEYDALLVLIDKIGDKISLAGAVGLFQDLGNTISDAQDAVDALEISENKLIDVFDDLNETDKKHEASLKAQADATKALEEAEKERISTLKDMAKQLEDINDEYEDQIEKLGDSITSVLEDEIELREVAMDLAVKAQQIIIDAKEEEIRLLGEEVDAYNRANDLLDEKIDKEKLLLKLKEAQDDLANIAEDTLILNADGETFSIGRDPTKVAEANAKIALAESELAEHEVEVAKNAQQRIFEDRKKALEDEKRLEEDSLKLIKETEQAKVDEAKTALEAITDITSLELGKQNDAWQAWADENSEIFSSQFSEVNALIGAMKTLEKLREDNVKQKEKLEKEATKDDNKTEVFSSADQAKLENLKSGASVNALSQTEQAELQELLNKKTTADTVLNPITTDKSKTFSTTATTTAPVQDNSTNVENVYVKADSNSTLKTILEETRRVTPIIRRSDNGNSTF